MVMHARKFPRLDDGYRDHNQCQQMEKKSASNSRNKYDRYANKKRDIPGIDGVCSRSPSQSSPRYLNKPGQSERKTDKDKDRVSVERRNDISCQKSHHGYQDIQKKDQKLKDHKTEVHKLAEKVCGDWSEHVSSSGKRYYYNCKTEISQWERPEDWNDMSISSSSRTSRTKDSSSSEKSISAWNKGMKDWSKHSSVSDDNCTKSKPPLEHSNSRLPVNNLEGQLLSDSHRTNVTSLSSNAGCSRSHGSSSTTSLNDGLNSNSATTRVNCQTLDGDVNERYDDKNIVMTCTQSSDSSSFVNHSRVYGLIDSGGITSDYQHLRTTRISDSMNTDISKCDDMDISPGSTPTEESIFEKNVTSKSLLSTTTTVINGTTPISMNTPQSYFEHPGSVTPSLTNVTPTTLLSSTSNLEKMNSSLVSNETVLNTLTTLQQVVSQLTTVDKTSTSGAAIQRPQGTSSASLMSCLALMPALISQLNSDKSTQSSRRQSDHQQITKQAIQLLQKLQQALVAQQQQSQLQQLLLQLLSVQKNSNRNRMGLSSSSSSHWTPPSKHLKLDATPEDNKSESPYSPPDSDGTPLGTPDTRPRENTRTYRQTKSPKNLHGDISKSIEEVNWHLSPPHVTSAVQPVSIGTSQLAAAAVLRKQDSTGLTPSLANYVNNHLTEHVTGWQVDVIEQQADCFAEEVHNVGSIHCSQVSVELKRVRSLVRTNEIQSTLQEQRTMSIRQRLRELEQSHSTVYMPMQDT